MTEKTGWQSPEASRNPGCGDASTSACRVRLLRLGITCMSFALLLLFHALFLLFREQRGPFLVGIPEGVSGLSLLGVAIAALTGRMWANYAAPFVCLSCMPYLYLDPMRWAGYLAVGAVGAVGVLIIVLDNHRYFQGVTNPEKVAGSEPKTKAGNDSADGQDADAPKPDV